MLLRRTRSVPPGYYLLTQFGLERATDYVGAMDLVAKLGQDEFPVRILKIEQGTEIELENREG